MKSNGSAARSKSSSIRASKRRAEWIRSAVRHMPAAAGPPIVADQALVGIEPAFGQCFTVVDVRPSHYEFERTIVFGRLQNVIEALLEFLSGQMSCHQFRSFSYQSTSQYLSNLKPTSW